LPVILDDKEARSFAEAAGTEFLGTTAVLLRAFVNRHLTMAELEDDVKDLSDAVWLAPAVVAEILKTAWEGKR
jgi:hypothetical protein